jgi:large subunit ribosomal protein L23
MQINQVLIKPIMTEKATKFATVNKYTFQVATEANKSQIRGAVEKLYSVKVARVTTFNRVGKKRRTGRRMISKVLPSKKIAIVYLKSGKIDLFPQT